MRAYAPRPSTGAETTLEPPPPAKRGRKPGPLSRTAREAQRRLNHSIIEKARRTKINDALATLKELVPAGYGQTKPPSPETQDDEDEDDEDDGDGEYTEGTKKVKPKPKATGKKEEKEKEFKLEILVRTVSFLQDLLKRVTDLEANAATAPTCQSCSGAGPPENPTKRKRIHLEEDDDDFDHEHVKETSARAAGPPRSAKIPRVSESIPSSSTHAIITQLVPVAPNTPLTPPTPRSPPAPPMADAARLPPISSWLPDSAIDPQLRPPSKKASSSPPMGSYLPSPPSSTHVDPVRMSHMPPMLSLGPVATAAMVNAPSSRSPEDESAASLLLQISAGSSPTFRPSSSSSISGYGLPDPSNFLLHSDVRSQREGRHVRQAQTPGSMLGLSANVIGSRKYAT